MDFRAGRLSLACVAAGATVAGLWFLYSQRERSRRNRRSTVVSLLDYGAGNVRSVRNAITSLGFDIKDITTAEDIDLATVIVFPGVGSFGNAMETLRRRGWVEPLKKYLRAGRPFFGICLGMQTLFEGSEESPGVQVYHLPCSIQPTATC